MGSFEVEPAALQHGDAVLMAATAHSRDALRQLRGAAAELIEGRWEGAAGAAFGAAWHEWLAGVEVLLTALAALAGTLGTAGDAYTRTDDTVRTSVVQADR